MRSSRLHGPPSTARRGAVIACVLVAATAGAEPLATRNENPVLAPFGLPGVLPSRLPTAGGDEVAATFTWSNSISIESRGTSLYHVDGETQELRVGWTHAFTDRLSVRAELPWRRLSGGTLDSAIEHWHRIWNLPNGDRDKVPRNQLLIQYRDDGATLLQVDRESTSVGDIPLAVGYQLASTGTTAAAAWLTAKVPVGRAEDLSGSEAVDVALSIAGRARLGDRWHWFGQADVTWLGKGDVLPQLQQSAVWTAMTGVTWNAWRGLDLTVQVDANTRVFDVPGRLASDAVVLGFGGSYRTAGGWRFDLGFGEDLAVDASPDFTMVFGVRRELPGR